MRDGAKPWRVNFLDELKAYLERVELLARAGKPDLAAHRKHLLEALRQRERDGVEKQALRKLHDVWSERLAPFCTELTRLLVEGLGSGCSSSELTRLVNIALSRELGLSASTGSAVEDLELDRLALLARNSIDEAQSDIARYCLEIRAVRRAGEDLQRTPIGQIFLELPPRDTIRWLLALEVTQAFGPYDEWRLSRTSAQAILKAGRWPEFWYDEDGSSRVPAASATLRRLGKLGLITIDEDGKQGVNKYALLPEGRPLLEEIAEDQPGPFQILAEALVQDETATILQHRHVDVGTFQTEAVLAATTRHARMVAHEIRNALVPVRVTIAALFRDLERAGEGALLEKHRARIDSGITRIFSFIKQMVDVMGHGSEPAQPFTMAPAIEDAVAAIAGDVGLNVRIDLPAKPLMLMGHRHRFTLAISNLLRNSVQARADARIEIRVLEEGAGGGKVRALVITVDDDGPGVPPQHRDEIFRPGVSLRGGGGGEGLALVREVVEKEMKGRVVCEDSPLGGARFTIRLPAGEERARA